MFLSSIFSESLPSETNASDFNDSNDASRVVAAGDIAVASTSDAAATITSGFVADNDADAAGVVAAGMGAAVTMRFRSARNLVLSSRTRSTSSSSSVLLWQFSFMHDPQPIRGSSEILPQLLRFCFGGIHDMISGRLLLARQSHEESRLVVLFSVGNECLLFLHLLLLAFERLTRGDNIDLSLSHTHTHKTVDTHQH
jgi:hypothetical protein